MQVVPGSIPGLDQSSVLLHPQKNCLFASMDIVGALYLLVPSFKASHQCRGRWILDSGFGSGHVSLLCAITSFPSQGVWRISWKVPRQDPIFDADGFCELQL
jgi:hypothetical protein